MFMAHASGARSAQFGRQVGAAIATLEGDVAAVGFNEVPAAGGGPYWDGDSNDARDHAYDKKIDSNYLHRSRIVKSIIRNLRNGLLTEENVKSVLMRVLGQEQEKDIAEMLRRLADLIVTSDAAVAAVQTSELKEITEYGRAVHAEMDAILSCARLGISTKGKQLFTTTFPCHNCTRHIIAAGISRLIYIEPYPKSRAADLHKDAICFDTREAKSTGKIPFVPFIGIGPRRYLDLFSLDLSTGRKIERKGDDGTALFPKRTHRPPRVAMLPYSYIDRENKLLQEHEDVINMLEGNE